jgi:DNA polymerase-4
MTVVGEGGVDQQRWVLHIDMDAFYASVEVKEQPALRGRPVVVGGTGPRGVVASASYEARVFGVRSAMPTGQARRLCPELVLLPPRFSLYHRYSEQLHGVLNCFTPLVEGVALDEAFLDVSGCGALFGPPAEIAVQLHRRVGDELGLACSIGAGPNKLVAKLASKAAKPKVGARGPRLGPATLIVDAPDVLGFIWPLPVEALWGVGPASTERLRRLGATTVGELAALPEGALVTALGKAAGRLLHALSWGRDTRPVTTDRAPKSIGHEETYPTDIAERGELHRRLVVMADSVAGSVRDQGMVARTVTLKLRYSDFATITRSHTFASPQTTGPSFWTAAAAMLEELDLRNGVRLLGVSASGLLPTESSPGEQLQLALDAMPPAERREAEGAAGDAGPPAAPGANGAPGGTMSRQRPDGEPGSGQAAWERASEAMDAVRARFGEAAVRPATTVEPRPVARPLR